MAEPALVYILAASHSGSTLTAMLLNAHPDICTAGELKATSLGDASRYRCSCRTLIGECSFWLEVADRMKRSGFEYDVRNAGMSLQDVPSPYARKLLRPLHRAGGLEAMRDALLNASPAWRSWFPTWAARNAALVRAVADTAAVRMVADSSKIALRLKYLRRVPGLRVKVLQLVRDGRAVALTYMRPSIFADAADPKLRGGGSGTRKYDELTMTAAAHEWRRSNEEAREVLRTIPAADQLQINYEDLCTDTPGTLTRVHRFLDLQAHDSFRDFRNASHHVVGNGMRLDDNSEVKLDDRWRQHLTQEDLREFERVAGDLNRSFGYQ